MPRTEISSHLTKPSHQVRKAFCTFQHEMFTCDEILFALPLEDWLKQSKKAKHHWLRAVSIMVDLD
eukprot:8309612-Ditylum_brightwellii.AAC.1